MNFSVDQNELEKAYELGESFQSPTISVTVKEKEASQEPENPQKGKTVISGSWSKKTISLKKTKILRVQAIVTPMDGRSISLQEKSNGKWVTRMSRTMKGSHAHQPGPAH